jgi:hypothetical protein
MFPQPPLSNIQPRHLDPEQNAELMCRERLHETHKKRSGIKWAPQEQAP